MVIIKNELKRIAHKCDSIDIFEIIVKIIGENEFKEYYLRDSFNGH